MGEARRLDSNLSLLSIRLKALRELGFRQLGLYALYRVGLFTGYFRLATSGRPSLVAETLRQFLILPERDELESILGQKGRAVLLAEADEIVAGQVRLFGSYPVALELTLPGPLGHWTAYVQSGKRSGRLEQDEKFLWEPARFGWAYTLGRAFYLNRDERYPAAFWSFVETFLAANPPFLGPHWTSGQEVALRLMAFAFTILIFNGSIHSTEARVARLSRSIADHAARILPTLVYACAQNNNHLLTEAAGLYTAGVAFPDHPSAKKWRSVGWEWFHRGLQSQIAPDGTYVQHSTNYHRLMLQVALWMHRLGENQGWQFPEKSSERLAAAITWLLEIIDPQTGRVPNLGPNDGAYILPLTVCPFHDYRPVLQTAANVFLGERPFSDGLWDEMNLWLEKKDFGDGLHRSSESVGYGCGSGSIKPPHIIRSPERESWAYLRVAKFTSRPGHADQLHLDLWWHGLNVAQDAGTYLYNAQPPWDNALTSSLVHNTVTVNGRDQMRRAGRFLYLDWAQAVIVVGQEAIQGGDGSWPRLVARHDGYRNLGVLHQRSVEAHGKGKWVIRDSLLPTRMTDNNRTERGQDDYSSEDWQCRRCLACVHWLLSDWPFEVEDTGARYVSLRVLSPYGWVRLGLSYNPDGEWSDEWLHLQIVRAGILLYGLGEVPPILGWSSPTYGDKIPALAVRLSVGGRLPFSITSEWTFPAVTKGKISSGFNDCEG